MSRQARSPQTWAAATSLLAVVVIVGVIWVALGNAAASPNPGQQATAPVTAPSAIETDRPATPSEIVPDLTATASRAAWETERAKFYTEVVSSPIATPEPVATGIRNDDEYNRLEWAKQGFLVENSFGGYVNGQRVGIFAGAHASNPEHGKVMVVWIFPYRTFIEGYLTPSQHGSVHIADEENNRLTLLSTDGTTYYFDIPGLTFTSSLTEVVPTIQPVPSYTPPVPPGTLAPPTAYPYPELSTAAPAATQTGDPDYQATSFALMTAVPQVTAVRPTGIFDAGAEFYHQGLRMQNAWQNQVNGYWANVVAGAYAHNPEQGVIFSAWEFQNGAIGQLYDTPTRAGSVRIIAEEDYRLTLEAADGTLFYWDIPSQSFVASLTKVVATITPPPTHTPTPGPQTLTQAPAPTGYPAAATAAP